MVMQNTRIQLGRGRSFPYSAVAFCCAVCCLIALGSIVGANFAINNHYKSWIESTGTVVGDVERIETYYENNRYRESLLYCGIIEYKTIDGETVQGETQTCSSSRWTVGNVHEILYNPNDTSEVVIEEYKEIIQYVFYGVMGLTGLCFTVACVGGLVLLRAGSNNNSNGVTNSNGLIQNNPPANTASPFQPSAPAAPYSSGATPYSSSAPTGAFGQALDPEKPSYSTAPVYTSATTY